MRSRRLSGLILLNTLECLKMALRTQLTHKFKNHRIHRNIVPRTNYSIFHLNFNKSIWYHNRLKKTFQRRHFCTVFIRKAKVQINPLVTTFRKFTLRWFVVKLKLISNLRSKARALHNIKLQDLRALLTSNMTIIPREACTDSSSLAVAQIFLKKPIFTMKWKDQNAFS